MKNNKVLIIGDTCLDIFRYGACDRLSPEAPVPVFKPTQEFSVYGMASNVYYNIVSLDDDLDIDLITNTKDIPKKIRIIDEKSNQMIVRIDENDSVKHICSDELEKLDLKKYDVIIISDYNKGFLNESDIEYIANNTSAHIFLDTKKKLDDWAKYCLFIKINENEYNNNYEWLINHYNGEVIVTRGNKGATWWGDEFPLEINEQHQVLDVSGAGDTFLAGLVVNFLQTYDLNKAIPFANKCAAKVVTKKGVARVKMNEI